MGGMRSSLPFLLLAALAHQIIALKCNAGCVGSSGNAFNYQPGTVYNYELEGATVMKLAGSDEDASKMTVKVTADVAALPNCGYSVSLTSFHVSDKDGKTVEGDKGQPVVFSMNNGAVQSDICSTKDEPIDAINVKRAIMSLLQTSPDTNYKTEVDIFGTCPTETTVHKSGSKLKVKKSKNLSNCAHRQNLMIPFTTTHYHSLSDLQSIPWISATQRVEQDVEGQVKWATSKEEYVMPPATGAEAGATITVTTKLTLKGTAGGAAAPEGCDKERTILLGVKEHTGENQIKNAGNMLKKICEGAKDKIDENNANYFAYLTYLLSRSNKATMTTLFNQIKQGQICDDKETAKKVLLDAIFDSQSAEGVQAMAELLKSKEVTGLKAQWWYSALGNVKHATIPSLKSVAGMIDSDAPIEAYLGAGSLLGRYCRTHSCDGVQEANQLQKKLSGPLTKGCKTASLTEEDKLLASIKGLGNSGYLSGGVTKLLIQCATDRSARSRVRSASLEALRADPNKDIIKKSAIGILKDKTEDSELRIIAYLIIVSCPCGKMAAVIKEVLEKEESFQVGNFIVSHLRNIRASKNPDKVKAQAHFSGILAPKSFPFDIRKYSTNMESSYMLESLNLGGSVESNVIYSQKSWIPKSVCVNVTSQLFGSSLNILELDVRTENLERMIEKIAGPRGYLSKKPEDIGQEVTHFMKQASERAGQTFRPKRGVSQNDIDALSEKVNLGADFGEHDESLDLSLKMFGSEVAWIPLHGAQLDKTPSESVNNAFDLLDGILDKAKNIDIDYTKHKVLAEAVVAYPTAIGVPLKIKGVVSTAFRVKLDGKVDIPAIMRDPKNTLIKFQIIPSGAVSASLISMVEVGGLNTGFKVTGTAHSSTGSDVTVRVLEGQGIDIKFGLPVAKQEASLKTAIVSFSDTVEGKDVKPVNFYTKREEYSGCFDQVSEFFGLTFCGEVSTPWDGSRVLSPAYGPTTIVARIEKEDPSLTNFHFKAYYNFQKDAPQQKFEIVLDTPNSKKERRIGVAIENTVNPNLGFKATVDSPFGNAKIETSAINTAAEKSINAELLLIDQEWVFKAGLKQSGPTKYKPFLEYKVPDEPKNRFAVISGHKQDQNAVTVSGDIEVQGNKLLFQGVKVTMSRKDYILDGSVWDEPKTSGVDLKVSAADDVFTLKGENKIINPHKSKTTLLVASKNYPDVAVSASWDFEFLHNKKQTKLVSDIVLVHGPDPLSETSRVTLYNNFHSLRTADGTPTKVEAKNLVKYPIVNLDGILNFNGDVNKLGYEVKGSFESYNGGSSLEIILSPEYTVDFTSKLMDNSIIVHMNRQKAGNHKSKYTNSLEVTPGGKYQLNSLVTHKFEPEDTDAHIEVKMTLPDNPKNIELKAGIKDNKQVYKGLLWASVDGKNLIDGKLNVNKGEEVVGNFKLVLPENVDSNGKLKFGPSGFDGNFIINMLKANKKVEGKTHMVINAPNTKGTGDLCLDGKCIKFSTDTTINQNSYETKNNVEFPAGLAFGLNAKGDESQGTHSSDAELKAANGHVTKVNYASTRHVRPGDSDVEYIISLEDVTGPGAKPLRLETKFVGKHIDLNKKTGDGQLLVTFQTPEEKDISIHANHKRTPAGDMWSCHTEVGVSGSLVEMPVTLKIESALSEKYFDDHYLQDGKIPPANYHFKLDLGDDLSIDSQGKATGSLVTNELIINMPNAKEGIKNFKWSSNNLLEHAETQVKAKTSNTVKWDEKFIKTNVELVGKDTSYDFNLDIEGDSIQKKSLSGSHHYCVLLEETNSCKASGNLALEWDGKKADITFKSEAQKTQDSHSVEMNIKGTALDGTAFEIDSKGICNKKGDQDVNFHGESTAVIGGKKWAGFGTVEIDESKKNINFIVEQPDGKKSQFKSLTSKKGDMHYYSEFGILWVSNGGGKMEGDMDINFQDENNFSILYNIDSPVMNLNKFLFKAKVNPDKKLVMEVKNNGKTIAAAKTTYQFSSEGSKKKIEGSGNINVQGTDYPLSYDATLDSKSDVRTFLQMSVNAKAGEHSLKFNSEGKPNNFYMKRTYCKSASECSEAEIKYENKVTNSLNYEQNILYKMDFSLFNSKLNDLIINSKIKSEGLTYNQNLDFDWGESKVNYIAYIQATKAGVSLALPQRTMAAEASIGTPKKDKNAVKIEGSVWLDKVKAPTKRTHLVIVGEVGQNKDLYTALGEIKFNNPALPKPLIVKGRGSISNSYTKPSGEGAFEIDVFKKPKMKIVGNWKLTGQQTANGFDGSNTVKVKSEELKLNIVMEQKATVTKELASLSEKLTYLTVSGQNKEAISKVELTPKKLHVLTTVADVTIIDYLAKWDLTESTLVASESIDYFGSKYSDHLDVQLTPHLQANYKFINNQGCDNKVLSMAAVFEMGKSTKLDVGFGGKTILSGEVSLAEGSFLKPEASYDSNAVVELKDCYEKSGKYSHEEAFRLVHYFAEHVQKEMQGKENILSEGVINWNEVAKVYQDEFEKIQDEVLADKNLQGLLGAVRETLNVFFENAVEAFESFQTTYHEIYTEIDKAYKELLETMKQLHIKLNKSLEELLKATSNLVKDLQKTLTDLVDNIIKEVSAHGEEINALFRSIGDVCEEYGKLIYKYSQQIQENIEAYLGVMINNFKEIPIQELINEQIEAIKAMIPINEGLDQSIITDIAQGLLDISTVLAEQLKQYGVNLPALDELLETLRTWLKKAVIDKEEVNNVEYAKEAGKELYEVIKHLVQMVQEQANAAAADDSLGKARLPNLSGLPLNRIPAGLLKMSGLDWITSSDLPSLLQVIATYLPAMSADDWTPPFTARAYLLGGSEIITFDGSHLSVGGDCSYVLTQDYLDGNFSVVAQFKGGKLDALQVSDGHDSVELRHDKMPLVNGKESEFPIFQGQIRSWKRAAVVGLSTKSGLKILCTPDCLRCKFRVDGLYFGRLRGLLGTYNYEQFDELTLPSGEIADSADKFLSAWAIGGCSAQSPATASREATCTKTFTDAPDFMACYHLVSSKPYRKACDSLAAKETTPEGLQAAVCNVAFAYSLQCQTRIPTAVPSSCLKCMKTNTNIFETTEEVKPPYNKADVVFTVERFESNKEVYENLIKPLIETIKGDLNAKGISDVKFGLVGFGGTQRMWPAYYTNHGKILSDDLEHCNLEFDTKPDKADGKITGIEDLFEDASAEAGVTGKSMTYLDLVEFYPWRMGSSKVVVGVHATPCKESHSLFMIQHLYYVSSYLNKGIKFHAVSPVNKLELAGGDASKVLVIDDDELFTSDHADKAKLDGEGDKEAENNLKYNSDVCFTFAHLTGGYVFPINNYLNGGAAEKDAFKKVLKTSVVESLTTNQNAQKCSCHPKTNPYDGIFSQPDCRIINI